MIRSPFLREFVTPFVHLWKGVSARLSVCEWVCQSVGPFVSGSVSLNFHHCLPRPQHNVITIFRHPSTTPSLFVTSPAELCCCLPQPQGNDITACRDPSTKSSLFVATPAQSHHCFSRPQHNFITICRNPSTTSSLFAANPAQLPH